MRDVERRWSFRDCVIAHGVLDALEEAEYQAHDRAKREAESARGPR